MPHSKNLMVLGVMTLIALGLGFWGWKAYAPAPSASETVDTKPTTQPAFTYTKTTNGDRKHTESSQYYDIDITYPDTAGLTSTAGAASDQAAIHTIETALQAQIDEFKTNQDFDHLTAEDKKILGFDDGRKYSLSITYKKKESPKTVSFIFDIYLDTGGAHPNSFHQTFTWNRDGSLTKLADLFVMGKPYLSEVAAPAKAQVTKDLEDRGASADAIFAEGFDLKDENFSNFYLEGKNLVILFPPYQVAAYAAGPQQAEIPLSSLKDLKSEYK